MGPKDMKAMLKGIDADYFINELGIEKLADGGIYEFHFHPGYLDQFVLDHSTLTLGRCLDVDTLCDIRVKEYIKKSGYELISFGDTKL